MLVWLLAVGLAIIDGIQLCRLPHDLNSCIAGIIRSP